MQYPFIYLLYSAASVLVVAPAPGPLAGAPPRRENVGTPVARSRIPAPEVRHVLVRVVVTASLPTHLLVPSVDP